MPTEECTCYLFSVNTCESHKNKVIINQSSSVNNNVYLYSSIFFPYLLRISLEKHRRSHTVMQLNVDIKRKPAECPIRNPSKQSVTCVLFFFTFLTPALLHRCLPSSGDGGGAWTSKTCGGWHCSHHLFPGSSCPVQHDGCLLCQQAAPEEAQEEKRWRHNSSHF